MPTEQLYRFFEGKTTIEEEQAIKQWLESSSENKSIYLKTRKLFDLTLLNASDLAFEEDKTDVGKRNKKIRLYSLIRVAAIVLFTFLATYFYNVMKNEQFFSQLQTINVPVGQRLNLQLMDGTDVWLNSSTTLKYPIAFNGKQREVFLDGEAHFSVKTDKGVPFKVKTSKGNVLATGTQFNVLAYSVSEDFKTSLFEGSVDVNLAENEDYTTLKPKTMSTLRNGKLEVSEIEDYNDYIWRYGLLSFKDATFEKMMQKFAEIYSVDIVIENTSVSKHLFTGKFRMNDGIDYSLRVLQRNIHFSYHRDDENNIIYIK